MSISITDPTINEENPLRIDCFIVQHQTTTVVEDEEVDFNHYKLEKMFFELDTRNFECPSAHFDRVQEQLGYTDILFDLYMQAISKQAAYCFDHDDVRQAVETIAKYIPAYEYNVEAELTVTCTSVPVAVFVYVSSMQEYEESERLREIFQELYPNA